MPQPINIGYAGDKLLSRIGATGIGFQSVIADDKGNPLPLTEALERMDNGERLQLHRFGGDGEAKGAIPIIKRGKEIFRQETDTRAGTFAGSFNETIERTARGGAGLLSNVAELAGADDTAEAMRKYATSPTTQRPPSRSYVEELGGNVAASALTSVGTGGVVGAGGKALLGGSAVSKGITGTLSGEAFQASFHTYHSVYNDAIQNGDTPEEANFKGMQAAVGTGAATAGINKAIFRTPKGTGTGGEVSIDDAVGLTAREPFQEARKRARNKGWKMSSWRDRRVRAFRRRRGRAFSAAR